MHQVSADRPRFWAGLGFTARMAPRPSWPVASALLSPLNTITSAGRVVPSSKRTPAAFVAFDQYLAHMRVEMEIRPEALRQIPPWRKQAGAMPPSNQPHALHFNMGNQHEWLPVCSKATTQHR